MVQPVTKRVDNLRGVWHEFNRDDFGSKLTEPALLIKRANKYDGKIFYRANRFDQPFNTYKLAICISEQMFPHWNMVYGTLLHEMIHQYQLQVIGNDAPHDAVFNSIARKLERKYNYPVR